MTMMARRNLSHPSTAVPSDVHMKLIDIDPEFGVAESTGQGKSMAIRRMFGIGRLNPDWTLPSRYGDNPLVWNVEVNGMLVDIRQESRERQEAAFQEGLIPYIPADRTAVNRHDHGCRHYGPGGNRRPGGVASALGFVVQRSRDLAGRHY